MKSIIILGLAVVFPVVTSATEKDVWYDAKGNVVKVTPAEKEKPVYVPEWKKREQERLARMKALRLDQSARSRSSGTIFLDPYASYYSHYPGYTRYPGYGTYYYRPGWSCRPHRHGRKHNAFRFQGSYQKNGWSLHVRF